MRPLNINTIVRVTLTDYGAMLYNEYVRCYRTNSEPTLLGTLHDGDILDIALWELAHIFGSILYMGNPNIPFANNQIELPI